jgi:tetratricopeptide (TPR) repeat protein
MDRKRRFLYLAVIILMLPALAGCGIIDQFKAKNHLNRGVKAYSSQRWETAEEEFKTAIQFDPELTVAILYLATTYRAQYVPGMRAEENVQKAEQAIKTFEQVLENEPGNVNAMANIAGIYSSLEENAIAKDWYRKLIDLDPSNPEPYYGIGTINWKIANVKTGNNGENVENLEEEEKAEVTELVESGVEALQKALDINPEYSEAMQFLNLMYRERAYLATDEEDKKKWENEAFKLALQALELKRQQEAEAERARRTIGGTTEEN